MYLHNIWLCSVFVCHTEIFSVIESKSAPLVRYICINGCFLYKLSLGTTVFFRKCSCVRLSIYLPFACVFLACVISAEVCRGKSHSVSLFVGLTYTWDPCSDHFSQYVCNCSGNRYYVPFFSHGWTI